MKLVALLLTSFLSSVALSTTQFTTVKTAIANLIPSQRNDDGTRVDKIGGLARLFFHDAFGEGDKPNGCLDKTETDNNGLWSIVDPVNGLLGPVCLANEAVISRADCWALAGIVALEAGGLPANSIAFRYGRADATTFDTCTDHVTTAGVIVSKLPKASPVGNPWTHIVDLFQTRHKLSTAEIVALIGVHALGRPSSDANSASGFSNLTWANRGTSLSNTYYTSIAGRGWTRSLQLPNGAFEWLGYGNVMLDVDMALVIDVSTCVAQRGSIRFGGGATSGCRNNTDPNTYVTAFGASLTEWFASLARGAQKLMETGYTTWTLGAGPETYVTTLCSVSATSTTKTCTTPATSAPSPAPATTCPTLSSPAGAVPSSCVGYTFGQVCSLSCNAGFVANNQAQRTCQTGGLWSGTAFTCTQQTCPTLTSPTNADPFTCASYTEGGACVFACSTGYSSNAAESRTCSSGAWTGSALVCTPKPCPDLNAPPGGQGVSCVGKVQGDTCATLSCQTGFTLAGSISRTCSNGAWTGTTLTCSAAGKCPDLAAPTGAVGSICSAKAEGDTCVFACDSGYSATSGNATRTCEGGLAWGANALVCKLKVCLTLESAGIVGAVTQQCFGLTEGQTCSLQCGTGYTSNGCGTKVCTNGAWTGCDLTCAANVCPSLSPPSGATGTVCEGKTEGQTCTFACTSPLVANGASTRKCVGGVWDGFILVCANPAASNYSLTATDWSKCSVDCGAGSMTRSVLCTDTTTKLQVDVSKCALHNGLPTTQSCTGSAGPVCSTYQWVNGTWGSCGSDCNGGSQDRDVYCTSTIGTTSTLVSDNLCTPLTKPATTQACNVAACAVGAAHWQSGAWAACSKTCGSGTHTRTVNCIDSKNVPTTATACTATKPVESEACNVQTCPGTYAWKVCGWDTCTAECGGAGDTGGFMSGLQTRTVYCAGAGDVAVDSNLCTSAKPTDSLVGCHPDRCTDANFMTTTWQPCMITAGKTVGTQSRTFHCHAADGSNVDSSVCLAVKPAPATVRTCYLNACPSGSEAPPPANHANSLFPDVLLLLVALPVLF